MRTPPAGAPDDGVERPVIATAPAPGVRNRPPPPSSWPARGYGHVKVAGWSPVTASAASGPARHGHGGHDGTGDQDSEPGVYNTTGLNDCPLEKWHSLDAQRLAKEFDVAAVYLNGPRFWTLDQLTAYATGETLSFEGIDARWVGELVIPPAMNLAGSGAGRFYSDAMIKRQTEWLFKAGRPVFELLTPDGGKYVMQAYSHLVDASLTLDSLPGLGSRLNLPEGWRYRASTPDQDLAMRPANGQAHVLQDELENTYMRLVTA